MLSNLTKNCTSTRKYLLILQVRKFQHKPDLIVTESKAEDLDALIKKYEKKVLFNSVIEDKCPKLGYRRNVVALNQMKKLQEKEKIKMQSIQPLPNYLKYIHKKSVFTENKEDVSHMSENSSIVHFPYGDSHTEIVHNYTKEMSEEISTCSTISSEIKARQDLLKQQNWMTAYENYEEDLDEVKLMDKQIWYGTPNPNSRISNVPCGGCGARLHCKDTAIPGYIPSEIFKNFGREGSANIHSVICQRCYFLKEFNMALQVRVSPTYYPKVLEVLKDKRALVLLLVDLLDFPCSLWPGIADIIGKKKPVMIVGNKVDLLPSDSEGYLERIKAVLLETAKENGLEESNIAHVSLLSALTGWGVEELITKIHNIWGAKGDVYIVGCTNVGKSSLFNALLQSDFCKVEASDLIQKATTSCWPGTTLNLLKFPILRLSGWRLYVRMRRLQSLRKIKDQERKLRKEQLKKTKNPTYATLVGYIDKTDSAVEPLSQNSDIFAIHKISRASEHRIGINEKDPKYALGNWCYDTPGVVQPDQIIHLLTTEELIETLPKQLIRPQSFRIKLNSSIFIAGLARLDYLEGPDSLIATVFCSNLLPLTVCETTYAEEIYKTFLGTKLFSVPTGSLERMHQWPGLSAKEPLTLEGINWEVSCADIVLSNAGWISITCGHANKPTFRAWTPEGRGICVRKCILPFTVSLRGKKIRGSVAYRPHSFFIK